VATLASTPAAAVAFEGIRDGWRDTEHVLPGTLRAELEQFLVQHPHDGLAPLASVMLALVALGQGDLPTADRELARGRTLPPGSTRDLWTVVLARRSRLGGDPEGALALLRPLIGKTVDPRRVPERAHADGAGDPPRVRGHLVHGRVAARELGGREGQGGGRRDGDRREAAA
jgi:hypothetical protein